ncbi:MAG: DUF4148 domain-containing protein [Rhodoferax sp.]
MITQTSTVTPFGALSELDTAQIRCPRFQKFLGILIFDSPFARTVTVFLEVIPFHILESHMNKVLIALFASLVAVGAFAADGATKTRAEVKAEAKAANKAGDTAGGEANAMAASAEAKLTKEEMAAVRASVKAEAKKANKKGGTAGGEANEMITSAEGKLSKEEMVALRAKVKAEAKVAVKKGTVKMGEQ